MAGPFDKKINQGRMYSRAAGHDHNGGINGLHTVPLQYKLVSGYNYAVHKEV